MKLPISIFIKRLKWSDYALLSFYLFIITLYANALLTKGTSWIRIGVILYFLYLSVDIIYKALRSIIAKSNYLDVKLESTDYEECIEIYTRKISEAPHNADNYFKRGYAYDMLDQNEMAINDFDQAIYIEPKNLAALAYRAGCKGALGDHDGCASGYAEILKISPNDRNALSSLGHLYITYDDDEKAILYFNKILNIDSNDFEVIGLRGVSKSNLGDQKGAIEDIDRALKYLPEDHEYSDLYYSCRGQAKAAINENSDAIQDFTKLIELSPDDEKGYQYRGKSWLTIGESKNAIIDFERALAINPDNMYNYYYRAVSRQKLEMHEEAEMDWTKIIEHNNDCYLAYAGRAEARRDSSKYEEAILDCDVLILNREILETAYNIRGYCKSMLGKLDESISDYLSGYEVNKNLGVLNNAGLSYERANRYNDAVLLYNRVIDINSGYSPAYVSRGYIKYNNQDFFGALDDWKKASSIGNEKATALLEIEEVQAHDGALYLDYKKLVDWCKKQDVKEAKGLPLDLMFTVTTIVKTKEDMVSVGWKKEDIDDLPIAMIYPLVSQFQTNILNTLEVKGNELIENRSMLAYDEIVFHSLGIKRDAIDNPLNTWWPGFFNTTLKQMWGK